MRLIFCLKTSKVSQKDKEIEKLEKNLKELREIMKRQPGAEEAKMIPIYQESLAQKQNQMKAMANELNLYQQQVFFCGDTRHADSAILGE